MNQENRPYFDHRYPRPMWLSRGFLPPSVASLVAVLGFLADKAQLKLDTNLDKASVIWTGLGGLCLGVVLIAIPLVIWFWSRRR